jgi:hypothetical protein
MVNQEAADAMLDKKAKAEYDRKYRQKNRARIKAKKAAYFQRTYDPVKAAKERKKKMPAHVEYCRQPEYVVWKKEYDKKRRESKYGEFKDAYLALRSLQKEIQRLMPDREERYRQSQRYGWSPLTHAKRREKRAEHKLNSDSL